jgi:hypothetical protein
MHIQVNITVARVGTTNTIYLETDSHFFHRQTYHIFFRQLHSYRYAFSKLSLHISLCNAGKPTAVVCANFKDDDDGSAKGVDIVADALATYLESCVSCTRLTMKHIETAVEKVVRHLEMQFEESKRESETGQGVGEVNRSQDNNNDEIRRVGS